MFKSLSDLAQVNPSLDLPAGITVSTDVSFIPMSDVTESGEWTGRQVRKLDEVRNGFTSFGDDDILIAKITPCFENGKGAHVCRLKNGVGFGSTEFHVLRARPDCHARYLHHIVQSTRFRRKGEVFMTGSAGQKRVPREFFDAFEVPLLNLAEQQKVAQVLDTLDTTIRQTEAIIAKLKQAKQGLLHDLLTRGIDANGELRPPQSEAPHLYKASPLGWVPVVWAVEPLGNLLSEPTRNGLYKPSAHHGTGPLMVQMGGLFRGEGVDFQSATRVQVTRSELAAFGLAVGDLLFARRSLVFSGAGQCVIVRHLPEPATFESSIIRARLDVSRVLPEFAGLYLRGERSSAQRYTLIRQVAVSGVSSHDVAQLLVATPPLAEQLAVIEMLRASDHRIALEELTLNKLRQKKSGLMDDLLTGRVRVTPLLAQPAAT